MTTVILITGANRGLGKGLVAEYASRPNTTVIAGMRALESSASISSLPTGAGSKIVAVQLASDAPSDAQAAIAHLQAQHGITHLDVVIANAGIASCYGPARTVPAAGVQEHFIVNALGPLLLFQAAAGLLQTSASASAATKGTAAAAPKFILVSSNVGSLADMARVPVPATAYGASKAAANYIVRKIHYENEWLVAFPLHPGWVQTDMGNAGARMGGLEKAPNTLEESVSGMVAVIDGATRESSSGRFWAFDGTEVAW